MTSRYHYARGFFNRYGKIEASFKAYEIQGSLEVFVRIQAADGTKIDLPAMDVTEGKNDYTVSLSGVTNTPGTELQAVFVYICSKTSAHAKFYLAEWFSEFKTATGTKTFKNEIKPASDDAVSMREPRPQYVCCLWGESPPDTTEEELEAKPDMPVMTSKYKTTAPAVQLSPAVTRFAAA